MEKGSIEIFDKGLNCPFKIIVSKEQIQLACRDPQYVQCLLQLEKAKLGYPCHDATYPLSMTDPLTNKNYTFKVTPDVYCAAVENSSIAASILAHAIKTSSQGSSDVRKDGKQDSVNASSPTCAKTLKASKEPLAESSSSRDLTDELLEDCDKDNNAHVNDDSSGLEPTDDSDEDHDETETNNKGKENKTCTWTRSETQLLLATYQEYQQLESTDQRKLWGKIIAVMKNKNYSKSKQQCQTKIRNLTKAYKKVIDSNKRTGAAPKTCAFFKELDELFSPKPCINPLRLAGDEFEMRTQEHISPPCNRGNLLKKLVDNQEKQMNDTKNYRQEKLNVLKEFVNVFGKRHLEG